MNELRALAFELKPHIIAVTETWGSPSMDDLCFKIDNYMMYRTDRINNRISDAGVTLLTSTANLDRENVRR